MKSTIKYILLLCLFIVLIFPKSSSQKSSASDQVVQVSGMANTGSRLGERIILFSKFSKNAKADYRQYLVKKRFGELQYVLDNQLGYFFEETTSRYSTYVGRLTNQIVKDRLVNKKEEVLKMYASHSVILEQYASEQEYDSAFWLLLQHDINYLKLYSDQVISVN